jgi:hypothetical protein
MKKLSSIALVGIAIVLATAASGHAAMPRGGQGFAGHPPSGHFQGHRAFDGRQRFDGRRFDRGFHGRAFIVAPFYWPYAYAYPPAYTYEPPAPTYWYYCQSYGAYYPAVQSCPEAWVPVPG